MLALSQQHAALQRWQQQLNPTGSTHLQQQAVAKGKGKAPPPGFGGGKAPVAATAGAAAGSLPAVPTLSLEEAVLAVCGVDAETAAAAYAAAAGEAADSSAARAALAAALAPKPPPRVTTAAEQAAVEAEVFGAKGRVLNAEAGARWLIQWCSKVTGGATGGDDTVATAVCRLLLSGARGLLGLAGILCGRGGAGGRQVWHLPDPQLPACVCAVTNRQGFACQGVGCAAIPLLPQGAAMMRWRQSCLTCWVTLFLSTLVSVSITLLASIRVIQLIWLGCSAARSSCLFSPCVWPPAVHATPPAALRHNGAPHRRSSSRRRAAAAACLGSLQCAAPGGRFPGG